MNKLIKKTLSMLLSGTLAFSAAGGLALAAEEDFAVSSIGITPDGSKITSITTVNAASGESAGVGVVAVYEDNMLTGLALTDSSAVVTAGTYDLKVPLSYEPTSDTYKAFVWDSVAGQKPLTEVYSGSLPLPTLNPTVSPTPTPILTPTPTAVVLPTPTPTSTPKPIRYTVTVEEGITNGTVRVDRPEAQAGQLVTLRVDPAQGYMLDTLTVTDANGGAVAVEYNQFTMPASNVTVYATFKVDKRVDIEVQSTYVDAANPDQNYSEAAERYANAAKILEDKLADNNGGQIVIVDFDASEYMGKIRSATLSFTATCQDEGKNSQVRVAKFADRVDTKTATWNTVTALEGVIAVNEAVGHADDKGTPLTCDVTKELRADADGKMSLAIYTYTARKQNLTDIKLTLEVEPEVIPQTTVTVNKVVQGSQPQTIIETQTIDVYAGDTYTATYPETFETSSEQEIKTAYYAFAGIKGVDDTIASLSETASENVITLPYTKTDYQTVTFTATLTDAGKAGVPIQINGTPIVTGTAIEEQVLTTGEDGTIAVNLLPGSYTYTITPTAEYLGVDAAAFTVGNAALPINIALAVNQRDPATLKVIYTTDGTVAGSVSEKVIYGQEASKFDGDEVAAEVFDAYAATVKIANTDDSGTYKVYNYVSGKPGETITLSAGENVVYITVTAVGDYYYYEAFDGDTTGYTVTTNGKAGVSNDKFMSVVQNAGSGSRYFGLNFNGMSDDITVPYYIEMDLSLRSAQSSNNGDTQFSIVTTAAQGNNTWITSDSLFTLGAHMQSNTWTLGATSSAEIDSLETKLALKACAVGRPYNDINEVTPSYAHVKVYVNPASENASLTIVEGETEIYNGTVAIAGAGRTVKGIKYVMGRQNGGMAVDNIKVYPDPNAQPTTPPTLEPTTPPTVGPTATPETLVLDRVVVSGGTESTLATGEEKTLAAFTAKAFTSNNVEIEGAQIVWSIENGEGNTAQMTIDPVTGVVTVPAAAAVDDTATVTATATYDGITKTATALITVKQPLAERLPGEADIDTMTTIATKDIEVGSRTVKVPTDGEKISLSSGFVTKKDTVYMDYDFILKDGDQLNTTIGYNKNAAFSGQSATIEFKAADGAITLTHTYGGNTSQQGQPITCDPNGPLKTDTWYRVTINTNVTGVGDESKVGSMTIKVYAVNEDGSIGELALSGSTTNLRTMNSTAAALNLIGFDVKGTPYVDNAYVYKQKAYDAVVTVTDGENPLEGVTVTADDPSQTTVTTDAEGKATLKLIPGDYTISVKKDGYEAEPSALAVTNMGGSAAVTMSVILRNPAALKVVYTTDGTVDTKLAEKLVDFGETKYVDDEVVIPSQYVGLLKINDEVDTNMYTVYNFVTGPQDNKVTLSAEENTVFVTYAKDKKYYTCEDFENSTADGFSGLNPAYFVTGAAGQGIVYKLRDTSNPTVWKATNWTTGEAQPITAPKTEIAFEMHYGWLSGTKTSTFQIKNSADENIVYVNYVAGSSSITSIKIGVGEDAEKLTDPLTGYQDGNDYNVSNKKTKIDVVVDYETNTATLVLSREGKVSTFTGDISGLTAKDVATWNHTTSMNNDGRCSTINDFKVFVPEEAAV